MRNQYLLIVLFLLLPFQMSSENINDLINKARYGDAEAAYQVGLFYQEQGSYYYAFEYFLKAAKNRNSDAQYQVGVCYLYGRGVPKDESKAMKWLKDAGKDYNNIDACFLLGKLFHDKEDQDCIFWMNKVIKYIEQSRNSNKSNYYSAYFYEGDYYYSKYHNGLWDKSYYDKGLKLFKRGAELGDVLCYVKLAELYECRELPSNSPEKEAFRYYKMAADKGDYKSRIELAHRYEIGEGVNVNKDSSLIWYIRAYEIHNDGLLAERIAELYLSKGYDYETIDWYHKANYSDLAIGKIFYDMGKYPVAYDLYSMDKSPEAYYLAAMMHLQGKAGLSRNSSLVQEKLEKAVVLTNDQLFDKKWSTVFVADPQTHKLRINCSNCTDEGYAPALYQLGKLYEGKDYLEASRYYRRAIIKGNDDAKVALAILLSNPETKIARIKDEDGAKELLEQACANKNANAFLQRATMELKTESLPVALNSYKLAAEYGSVEAQLFLGKFFMDSINSSPDYQLAFQWLSKAATANNSDAQNRLGWIYEHGCAGIPRDNEKAFQCYYDAVHNEAIGDEIADAQYNLARAYERKSDNPRAISWYQEAIKNGNRPAYVALAAMYRRGIGSNSKEALKLLQEAANQGYSPALWDLAEMYAYGIGTDMDKIRALKLYKQAAASGYAELQYKLGDVYKSGQCTRKDFKTALKWYKLAADQGHVEASMEMARLYESGDGTGKVEPVLAFQRYENAANKGCVEAMYRISEMYRDGEGTKRDVKKANEWEKRAKKAQGINDESINHPEDQNKAKVIIKSPSNNSFIFSKKVKLDYEFLLDVDEYAIDLLVNRERLDFQLIKTNPKTATKSISFDLPDNQDGEYNILLTLRYYNTEFSAEPIVLTYRRPDLWLLSVGINNYVRDDNGNGFPELNYAALDAQIFYDYFKKQPNNAYGNIHGKILINEEATQKNITDALLEIRKARTGDRVLLYFSGHGVSEGENSFFACYDATKNNCYSGVSFKIINDEMKRYMDAGGQVILFFDACYSGLINAKGSETKQSPFAFEKLQAGIYTILSCQKNEVSREDPELKHGVFSHFLFQGLKNCELQENGYISLKALSKYITDNVSEQTSGRQNPTEYIPSDINISIPELK